MKSRLELNESTILTLRPLRCRVEGDSAVVGSAATGRFIEVPAVAVDVIDLLGAGRTLGEARAILRDEHGLDLDVTEFAQDLVELDFVAELDGRVIPGPSVPPVSLGRVRPSHVAWLLDTRTFLALGALLLLAVVAVAIRPELLPSYHELVWHHYGGLVIAVNTALIWAIIYLHELGHLLTARAANVPGRISLGTRLQFLVAQTEVSAVWAEPRRVRVAVYLAGIAVNLGLAAVGILVRAVAEAGGGVHRAAGLVVLLALLLVLPQAAVFMRTDLYFLLQDLTGCRELYADGTRYLRHRLRRLAGRAGGEPDPAAGLDARERRAVRWYSVLLLVGTVACLWAAAAVSYPALVLLLARALHTLTAGAGPAALADAGATVVTVLLVQGLWLWAWWRRHRARLTGTGPETERGGDHA